MMVPVFAQDVKPEPKNLTMTLARIIDAGETEQYVFVINGVVAFKSLDGLKKHLKDIPKGYSLTWAPGCCRTGSEPLIRSEEEMREFKEFCETIGINFILVPSG